MAAAAFRGKRQVHRPAHPMPRAVTGQKYLNQIWYYSVHNCVIVL